jgi:predicted dehydrogenase
MLRYFTLLYHHDKEKSFCSIGWLWLPLALHGMVRELWSSQTAFFLSSSVSPPTPIGLLIHAVFVCLMFLFCLFFVCQRVRYHAMQLIDGRVEHAELKYVVEPWYFLKAAKGTPGYDEFQTFVKAKEEEGICFYETVSEVPARSSLEELRLGIISARTADNPKLMDECLEIGCTSIYLEKPGAPTVVELEAMRKKAVMAGVKVFMGFNKNVSAYLIRSREFVKNAEGKCYITFLHNNAYENTERELAECFERNAEGMLKNMAIHELAILVTYYGVTVDTIEKVEADKEFSSCKTLKGPSSGKDFTDFVKLKFKIVSKDGTEISVAADRCGGDDSVAIVTNESGKELVRYTMPDDEAVANTKSLKKKYGDAMPYFFAQDPDYLKLKALVVQNCVDGSPAHGVATIDIAVDTLKVAEYLTPILQKQLL